VRGNIDDCELTDEERSNGISVADLIKTEDADIAVAGA
jgi:hypothetical protein